MKIDKYIKAAAVLAAVVVSGCQTPEPSNEWYKKLPNPATLKINEGRRIKFANPLPRWRCGEGGEVLCGTHNNRELSLPGALTTSDPRLGLFLQKLRETIMANRRLVFVDGKVVVCNHNWIRDHVHQMKGWKHWESDPLSFLQLIIDTQRADGQFFELVKQMDDPHWNMVGPESRRLLPEDNVALARMELEADVEYLVVEGAWQYYRMTGDDKWLASVLPALEKGIDYQTSDPMRWEPSLGLCIRPYTIDTWDYTNDPESGMNRRVAGKPLCAMHGDNTGVYQAMKQLAWMNRRLGSEAKASEWDARAATLRENIMKHLWNGRFFVHQLPVRGTKPLDGNEANRLSLSDAYALNRGILTGDESRAVIDAFIERGKTAGTFAEFFTIDPPYEPSFNWSKAGEYVNGAISPFTAGELAKGAFRSGREAYGWNIISRWIEKVENDKAVYFLYDRKNGTSISENSGPSAWGAAALMDAVEEGLAGIVDAETGYDVLEFSPRWPVTPYRELRYVTGYEMSKKYVDVRHIQTDEGFRYHLRSPASKVKAHLLVPEGRSPKTLLVNGKEVAFTLSECEALVRANGHVMNRDQILEGYMIMGGVPYYWDLLRKDIGFAQNIDALFFAAHGELSEEFDHLFLSLFRKPKLYISIIRALGTRKCGMTRNEIIAAIGATGNGMLTRALKELAQCDFIRVYAEPGRRKRDLIYQLIDNYVLFYFRFIDGQTNLMPNFWSVSQTTQAVRVWCGLAFERVALQHVAAIKRKLGISGVVTRTYGWRFQGDGETNAGAQIDLVIDRDDKVVNLCEMKYTAGPFSITDEYDRRLKVKREVYAEQTGTKSAIHLTMVSAHGLKANANAFDVQSVITLDDLFRE